MFYDDDSWLLFCCCCCFVVVVVVFVVFMYVHNMYVCICTFVYMYGSCRYVKYSSIFFSQAICSNLPEEER